MHWPCRKSCTPRAHPALAQSIDNLAYALAALGKFDEAEPLTRQALAMKRLLYGEVHPETAMGLNNLAYLLESRGNFDGGRDDVPRSTRRQPEVARRESPDHRVEPEQHRVRRIRQGGAPLGDQQPARVARHEPPRTGPRPSGSRRPRLESRVLAYRGRQVRRGRFARRRSAGDTTQGAGPGASAGRRHAHRQGQPDAGDCSVTRTRVHSRPKLIESSVRACPPTVGRSPRP